MSGIAITIATVAAVLLVYLAARRGLHPDPDERTRDLAASMVMRVSALHGLVLALIFASEVVEYQQLGLEVSSEVNAVSDISYDALRYGQDAAPVHTAIRDYLALVPSEEWQSLATTGNLSGAAWGKWNDAYLAALDLVPATPRETSLRENMLDKIHAIAEIRDLREHHAKTALSPLFWGAALAGVLLVALGFYTFPPRRDNLALISLYGLYIGFIFFTIYAMANPFKEPAALDAALYRDLLVELDR